MTKILNLFPTSSHLPFRWYPLTEAYRRFLREKAIGTGVCIRYPAAGRHIYLERGVNRDYFIDNFLVSGMDVYLGKIYCTVEFDNIICMCSREVRQSVYDAIQSAPQTKWAPFISNNKLFELFENDLNDDLEKMSRNIEKIGYNSPLDQLSILKLLALRFEQESEARNFFTTICMQYLPDIDFEGNIEMLKIAKYIFNEEDAAKKLLSRIKKSEEYEVRRIEVRVAEKYMFNKPIESGRLLRSCINDIDFANIHLNNIRHLCMYFDFALAHELWKKADISNIAVENFLNIAILAEYQLDRKKDADTFAGAAKNSVGSFDDTISFLRYVIKTGREKKFLYQLFTKYPRIYPVSNSITVEYLKSLKYGLEDFDEYARVKREILKEETLTMLLLDIAEALYYFDATLEDLDEYYLEAKKR
ncbi:MAG: hypothetical protein IT279_03480, partial [Ignavibacteriaceae bacterium]|nr:hypothetical protein [Ignavibacteriaceae bacterium]